MRRLIGILLFVSACTALRCIAASAWDVNYDGNVLPNDAALGSAVWCSPGGSHGNNLSNTSVADGVLHLVDQDATKTAFFYKDWSLPNGTPITLETRVRIASGAGPTANVPPVRIEVGRSDGCVFLGLWPDKIRCGNSEHSVDMTAFHIVRVALQGDNHYQVWLDGSQVFSGSTISGTQAGIVFGSSRSPAGTLDSFWDYVNYSKAYIPVE